MTRKVHHLVAFGFDLGQQKRRRQRTPRLDRAIAQAEKAGKRVSSITTPDGVTLTFGEETKPEDNKLDEWIAKHAHSTERH